MDYLKALRDDPDLAEEFDSLFDFFLLEELSPRDEADGRATFTLPGMAFARDGSGGEYHLLPSNLHTARHGFCQRWLRRRIPPVGRWLHRLLQQ